MNYRKYFLIVVVAIILFFILLIIPKKEFKTNNDNIDTNELVKEGLSVHQIKNLPNSLIKNIIKTKDDLSTIIYSNEEAYENLIVGTLVFEVKNQDTEVKNYKIYSYFKRGYKFPISSDIIKFKVGNSTRISSYLFVEGYSFFSKYKQKNKTMLDFAFEGTNNAGFNVPFLQSYEGFGFVKIYKFIDAGEIEIDVMYETKDKDTIKHSLTLP